MSDKVKRAPRKVETPDPTSATTTAGDAAGAGADTEGHSMLQLELARQMATSRSREAAEWARSEKARREAKGSVKRPR